MKNRANHLLVVCVIVGIVIQFLGPMRSNPPVVKSHTIGSQLQIPPHIADIMDRACMDCHSHQTRWPWYSRVAPVRWWLMHDVNDARNILNLSEWTQYQPSDAAAALGSMGKAARRGLMPLAPYRALHPSARLSAEEIKEFSDWAEAERLRILNSL